MVAPNKTKHLPKQHQPLSKKKTAEKKYQERTSAPKSALDWQLALSDVLTDIGRENFANLVKKNLEQKEWEEFQAELAYVTFIEQKRVKEQILREVEYAEERARERLLKSWADSQLKNVPLDGAPKEAKGLLSEILDLLLRAGKLTAVFNGLAEKQEKLNEKWDKLHKAKAEKIIDKILDEKNADKLDPELVEIVNEKKDKLIDILTPIHPDLMLKINPHLAKRLDDLSLKDERLLSPIFLNVIKANDFIGELGFHANLTRDTEPLTGRDLLNAMLGPKGPDGLRIRMQGRQQQLRMLNIPFQSTDHIAKAALFQEAADMYQKMQNINIDLDAIDKRVKENVQEIKQVFGMTPKLKLSGSKRKHDELETKKEHIQPKYRR